MNEKFPNQNSQESTPDNVEVTPQPVSWQDKIQNEYNSKMDELLEVAPDLQDDEFQSRLETINSWRDETFKATLRSENAKVLGEDYLVEIGQESKAEKHVAEDTQVTPSEKGKQEAITDIDSLTEQAPIEEIHSEESLQDVAETKAKNKFEEEKREEIAQRLNKQHEEFDVAQLQKDLEQEELSQKKQAELHSLTIGTISPFLGKNKEGERLTNQEKLYRLRFAQEELEKLKVPIPESTKNISDALKKVIASDERLEKRDEEFGKKTVWGKIVGSPRYAIGRTLDGLRAGRDATSVYEHYLTDKVDNAENFYQYGLSKSVTKGLIRGTSGVLRNTIPILGFAALFGMSWLLDFGLHKITAWRKKHLWDYEKTFGWDKKKK